MEWVFAGSLAVEDMGNVGDRGGTETKREESELVREDVGITTSLEITVM